nr:GIY-YIG nuclease family protein [uncultured Draconibacterium sp.]
MKKSSERQMHFGQFSSPTPDSEGYNELMDSVQQNINNNPKLQGELKRSHKQASSIWFTQSQNGINLLQDSELRFFLNEFNDRTWKHGFSALPSSFNVLEGFFKWNPKLFYFELLEEEEHLFSLFDFFDFVTSKNCSNSLDYFIENTEDELIYTYNIINNVKELTFSTSDSKEYAIGGVSFVKREGEVIMLLVAGELGDVKEFSKQIPDYDQGDKTKSYLKPADDREKEAVKLFDQDDIWKVNIYVRIDLENKTIDSRYIQKDTGVAYSTITDDYGMLMRSISDEKALEQVIKRQAEEIATYESIFEAAYSCLYLPEYFDYYDEHVLPEEHPTNLYDKTLRKPLSNKVPKFHPKYFFKTKDVWVLDRNIDPVSGKTKLSKTELKIEKDGYWKPLEHGKIGTDKNGKEIHGRTWVEKTLSWQELSVSGNDVEITIPENVSINNGYIYLLRNPAHELDLFKIGLTTKQVEERAKQLSGTPSPDKFVIINRWFVKDCVLAEKLIHEKLAPYRLNPRREFFKIKLETAIMEIIPIIEQINK